MKLQRMCGGCMKRDEKSVFLRVVRDKDGAVIIDDKQKLSGRGVYVCKNEKCIDMAMKKKWISRGLKCDVPSDIYEKLKLIVNSKE